MKWQIKQFNELTGEEIYKILQLRNEIFIVEQKCPYNDCDGKDKDSYHLFLEDNDRIVAYLRIIEKRNLNDMVAIGRVVVNKNYRKRNLGREMLLKAILFIEEELCERQIRIQAQSYLYKFYKSLGFKTISKEYLEDGIPHIDMIYEKLV